MVGHTSGVKLCQIGRVKYLFDRSTLFKIINALVFGKLFYCSSVWAVASKKNIERLQKADLSDDFSFSDNDSIIDCNYCLSVLNLLFIISV